MADTPLSLASQLPQVLWCSQNSRLNYNPGGSEPARESVVSDKQLTTDTALSRAGSLPHWISTVSSD
ncbi:MAG: hypothetical protein C0438_01275 [Pseudomonas sp.]|nr:hypothetical protein [Pseudomonas sp.]